MATQTFGDILFSPGQEYLKEFPSPESLKKRIIISTKPPKEYLEAKEIKENDNDLQKGKAVGDEVAWGREISNLKGLTVANEKVCGDVKYIVCYLADLFKVLSSYFHLLT
jgi:phosphatidylinositol phospholipase C delta